MRESALVVLAAKIQADPMVGETPHPMLSLLSLLSLGDETIAATFNDEFDTRGREPEEMPERIGRYLVIERIGSGGMGVVYAAYDPDLDRKLALKLLHRDEHERDERTRLRLLREAQALARVSHPNVIQVYDVGTFEDRVYIAMEFVEGQTLHEWLDSQPRELSEITAIFSQAGHGLAAAHAKDLVHRDFKPDNVIVTRDGRAVVLDFGIAYAIGSHAPSVTQDEVPAQRLQEHSLRHGIHERMTDALATGRGASSVFDAELTHAGALMGTPAYMAPEQFDGGTTDARTDQFSFCVALWEAIHGQRPFAGDTPMALWRAVRERELRSPSSRRMPVGLQRAICRGLERAPEDRFSDLARLLAILDRDPRARRRWIALVSVAVGAVGFGLWGLGAAHGVEQVCRAGESRLDPVWSGERREAVIAAFGATGEPLAAQVAPKLVDGIDTYAREWAAMYTDACEATRVRGEQSEQLLDLRMDCLEDRKRELDAVVEVLLEPDAKVVANGHEMISTLRPIESCADRVGLRARVAAPYQPEVAERVESIQRELSRARARRGAADFDRAFGIAREAHSRAMLTEYRPIQAAAAIELGMAHMEKGSFEAAAQTLREGFYLALAGGDEAAAVEAAIALVQVSGDRLEAFDEAFNWARIADAILDRRGDQRSRARVELQYLRGLTLWRQGELGEAREQLEAALDLAEGLGDHRAGAGAGAGAAERDSLLEIRIRKGLGSTLWAAGEPEEAAREFQVVVETLGRELGEGHPSVGSALNNLASAHFSLGRYDLAEREFLRSLDINESVLGPEHPSVATSLNNLAVVYTLQGKLEQARDTHLRVLELQARKLEPGDPKLANSWSNLGRTLFRLRDFEGAVDYNRRAYTLRLEVLGPEHEDTLGALQGVGVSEIALGQGGAGLAKLERVVEGLERELGPDHPTFAAAQADLGGALVELERPREGEVALRAALAIRERVLPPDHPDIALNLLGLARAAQARGKHGVALEVLDRFEAMAKMSEVSAFARAEARFRRAQALVSDDEAAALEAARAGLKLLEEVDEPNGAELRRELTRWLSERG